MNEDTYNEFRFFLNIYGSQIGDEEKNKILSISTKLINSENYMKLVKEDFDKIMKDEKFDLSTDFGVLVKVLIELNQFVDFYKEIDIKRLKFLLYPVIFAQLYKYHIDIVNKMNITDFRVLYSNAMDLVLIPVESVRIAKESCSNCLARKFDLFKCLENKKRI